MVGPRGDLKAGSPKLRRRVILGQVRAWLVMGGSQAGSSRGGEEVWPYMVSLGEVLR